MADEKLSIEMHGLVPPERVSLATGICVSTLASWRHRGGGPPFVRLGHRTVRYDLAAVEKWAAERHAQLEADRVNATEERKAKAGR